MNIINYLKNSLLIILLLAVALGAGLFYGFYVFSGSGFDFYHAVIITREVTP